MTLTNVIKKVHSIAVLILASGAVLNVEATLVPTIQLRGWFGFTEISELSRVDTNADLEIIAFASSTRRTDIAEIDAPNGLITPPGDHATRLIARMDTMESYVHVAGCFSSHAMVRGAGIVLGCVTSTIPYRRSSLNGGGDGNFRRLLALTTIGSTNKALFVVCGAPGSDVLQGRFLGPVPMLDSTNVLEALCILAASGSNIVTTEASRISGWIEGDNPYAAFVGLYVLWRQKTLSPESFGSARSCLTDAHVSALLGCYFRYLRDDADGQAGFRGLLSRASPSVRKMLMLEGYEYLSQDIYRAARFGKSGEFRAEIDRMRKQEAGTGVPSLRVGPR